MGFHSRYGVLFTLDIYNILYTYIYILIYLGERGDVPLT
jgi:hypothetical protein